MSLKSFRFSVFDVNVEPRKASQLLNFLRNLHKFINTAYSPVIKLRVERANELTSLLLTSLLA